MIARVWKGAVGRADADEYAAYIRETGVADYTATPGNHSVWMLRRDRTDDRTEFVMFTLWESLDAVRAFAGEDYEQAVFYPEDERFLVERDDRAVHYDVAASEERGQASAHASARVDAFVHTYRAGFEAFDAEAIADLFAYPCLLTGAGDRVEVTAVSTREAWLRQIERLLAAYRGLGIRGARVAALRTIELAPDLLQAVVRWDLVGGNGRRIYAFDATYTLADLGEGLRITAVAHNETPQLRARLAGSGGG